MTGSSTQGIKIVLHPVSDLATAKAMYAALLGMQPQADSPYYVGFDAEGQHIGLVPGAGQQGMTSPVAYWEVSDIEVKLAGDVAIVRCHSIYGVMTTGTFVKADLRLLMIWQKRGGEWRLLARQAFKPA